MLLRRLSSLRHIVVSAGALGALACGGASGPADTGSTGQVTSPIDGGELDTEHDSVFALVADHKQFISSCTATLIAPNLLLTARHCVSALDDVAVVCGRSELGKLYAPENLYASNPVLVRDPNQRWFQGASIRVPAEGDDTCGYDVAMVMLDQNVPEQMAKPSIPRIDRAVQRGEMYEAVGYGVDENGDEPSGRQVRTNLSVACAPGNCGRIAAGSEFVGETGICSGDSGGPAFDAAGKVVGVVSRGAEDCSGPIYGAVAGWRDLIISFAQEAAVLGGYEPAFWVKTGVSDPPPIVVVGPGDACGLGRDCPTGHACHAGTCTARCLPGEECGSGLSCQPSDSAAGNLCLPAPQPEPELEPEGSAPPTATCAYRPTGRSGASPLGALSLAIALGLWRARVRRTRARVAL